MTFKSKIAEWLYACKPADFNLSTAQLCHGLGPVLVTFMLFCEETPMKGGTYMAKKKDPYICKGCGAPCKWIKMLETGKRMLVDVKPEYRIMLLEDIPRNQASSFPADTGVMARVYMQHWATCPERDRFKKKKGESDAHGQHDVSPGQSRKAHTSGEQSTI